MAKIYDTTYTQTLAKKLLECIPECMLNEQEVCLFLLRNIDIF